MLIENFILYERYNESDQLLEILDVFVNDPPRSEQWGCDLVFSLYYDSKYFYICCDQIDNDDVENDGLTFIGDSYSYPRIRTYKEMRDEVVRLSTKGAD